MEDGCLVLDYKNYSCEQLRSFTKLQSLVSPSFLSNIPPFGTLREQLLNYSYSSLLLNSYLEGGVDDKVVVTVELLELIEPDSQLVLHVIPGEKVAIRQFLAAFPKINLILFKKCCGNMK